MPDVDLTELCATYADLLSEADPLLPEPVELAGDVLVARVGESVAAGAASFGELDPQSLNASWGALGQHRLRVQVAGPDPAAAFDALLHKWDRHLAEVATPGDEDCAAMVNWPSRLTTPVRPLARHGFSPGVVIAIRTAAAANDDVAEPGDGLTVRRLEPGDLGAALELYRQLMDYDARFGMVTVRPSTMDRLRELLESVLERDVECMWVAERDGQPVGMSYVDLPPDHVGWITPTSRVQPVGYFACMVVDEKVRGRGAGGALAARAHGAVAAAGATATLLHHGATNPLSTPFWYRHGYRPLWTAWQRRPVLR